MSDTQNKTATEQAFAQQRAASFMDLRERSMQDPKFRALVDMLYAYMVQSQCTPYELRDAAYMASVKFAQYHFEPYAICTRFPDEAAEILRSMGSKKL